MLPHAWIPLKGNIVLLVTGQSMNGLGKPACWSVQDRGGVEEEPGDGRIISEVKNGGWKKREGDLGLGSGA